MTTPPALQPEATPPPPKLSPDNSAGINAEALESYARLTNLGRGLRRARALDAADTPPEAAPRDLAALKTAMTAARENQAFYYSSPDWRAILDIHQQVEGVLTRLNEQAKTTPQTAIHTAKITTLAASLIARHAAKVGAHLNKWEQHHTPGGQSMRALTRIAEDLAVRAAGLGSAEALDNPRLLMAHVHQLNRQLRKAEADAPEDALALEKRDDPQLRDALTIGATFSADLAEASHLMTALTEMNKRARRAGHRLTRDVRLHGLVETAQLRGMEMIAGIARTVMRRYDAQGHGNTARRTIAAVVLHHAEQRLERMRGSLGPEEQRDLGHYEQRPNRYLESSFEEHHRTVQELSSKYLRPEDRLALQIRNLLATRDLAQPGNNGAGYYPLGRHTYPPSNVVAGMQTGTPIETRLELIDALRRQAKKKPHAADAPFLNSAADHLAEEIAGPLSLTAEAREADISADQVRAVAAHLVSERTLAAPFALSEKAELNLTHAQAERVLDVLQSFDVVGPPRRLMPRATLVSSRRDLLRRLDTLEQRLPDLLARQNYVDPGPRLPSPPWPAGPAHKTAPSAPMPSPGAPDPTASTAELPRRNRAAERRHPGNLSARPAPTTEQPAAAPAGPLAGQERRLLEASQKLKEGTAARAAAHPAPPVSAPLGKPGADEAHHNARQAQENVGTGIR
ncbi:hypothetical protein ABT160_18930 [Streptomyces sp. NPDC001941]|uniref:hypothetical protein n=1 Tax=Streptomyces sp. NPDC001941 TaxID=3154659 RepID=UPI0033340D2E